MDVLADLRPILLIDEPQRLGSDPKKPSATLKALASFNALCALRYSATHKIEHNLVYRLDARDAYRKQLVKQVVVTGLEAATSIGTARVEVLSVERRDSKKFAVLRLDQPTKTGAKPVRVEAEIGQQLSGLTKPGNPEYRDVRVSDINVDPQAVELSNGDRMTPLELASGGQDHDMKVRTWQIGRVIDAHLQREQALFPYGVKVLSLFFVDEVKKYKDYSRKDRRGVYARVFEQEYADRAKAMVQRLEEDEPDGPYLAHLRTRLDASESHDGYFSKNAGKQLIDGSIETSRCESGAFQGHCRV